ncbi:MAG: hypothetical protein ACT4NY_03795 [Pseudonocardiales bacterium]
MWDRNGDHEVDLIAELDAHRLVAIEVKVTAAPQPDSARHLIWLRAQLGERFTADVVLHIEPTGRRSGLGQDRVLHGGAEVGHGGHGVPGCESVVQFALLRLIIWRGRGCQRLIGECERLLPPLG